MPAPAIEERLAAALRETERACHLLLTPTMQSLDDCLGILESASVTLADCRSASDAALLETVLRLRQTITRAGKLLDTAAEYHRNWHQILRARLGGYTASGGPVELPFGSRLAVQG